MMNSWHISPLHVHFTFHMFVNPCLWHNSHFTNSYQNHEIKTFIRNVWKYILIFDNIVSAKNLTSKYLNNDKLDFINTTDIFYFVIFAIIFITKCINIIFFPFQCGLKSLEEFPRKSFPVGVFIFFILVDSRKYACQKVFLSDIFFELYMFSFQGNKNENG